MILPNNIMDWLVIPAAAVIVYMVIITLLRLMFPEQYLDWNNINLQDMSFPDNFFAWVQQLLPTKSREIMSTIGHTLNNVKTKSWRLSL